jgi:hypothetical protein
LIVIEIAESIGLPLQHFHLGAKAFGNPVIASEAPHGADLGRSGSQGLTELEKWG